MSVSPAVFSITWRAMRWRYGAWALVGALTMGTALAAGTGLRQLPQSWREDDGRAVELRSLTGHRVILTMAYASCHVICPSTIAQLKRMQLRLDNSGEQADFVVIGYDPQNDDPATWHQYRSNRHLDRGNWHFLSGSRDDTERLARQLGFEFWKYDEHVMHGARALVFNAHGEVESELGPEIRDWAGAL
jgi:cytochrome oxidase Cu insertion factor (SCO1/SenC/PrrC family)